MMEPCIVIAFAMALLGPTLGHKAQEAEPSQQKRVAPNSTVCYDDVGCFNNAAPFNNAANELPQSSEYVNTTFRLYTRHNTTEQGFEVISYKNDTPPLTSSDFDASRMTRVIVHGFYNSGFEPWVLAMKDAFLQIEDSNVITVDWRKGAVMPFYTTAVANTRLVGRQLRLLLQRLMQEAGLRLDRVHLIGHSLGAHVSGYTGRDLKGQLYRITALDPAAPLFSSYDVALDLDKTDAVFVDVVHSNAKPLESGGVGLFKQVGHVDFYVNGGRSQPGCSDGVSAILAVFHGNSFGDAVSCSHARSHDVFVESITSDCPFTAYPCANFEEFEAGNCLDCGDNGCSEMGLYSDQHKARGTMFLKTRVQSPYCGFHYSVTVSATAGTRDTSGQLSVQLSGSWGDTDFVSVTEEKETLKSGMSYGGVVVASTEVGIIKTLSIRYDKADAFLWMLGGGRKTFSVDRVRVVSGESGKEYNFCLQGQQLTHAEEITLTVGGSNEC